MTCDPSHDQHHFWLSEEDVANQLGIAKELVRKNRGPEKGRWIMGPRKRPVWSFAGMSELREALAATMSKLADPQACVAENVRELSRARVPSAASVDDGVKVLEVMSCRFENSRVMHCVDPESPLLVGGLYREPIVCWVADSRRFLPGMKILARRREGRQSNVWDFAGCPDHPAAGPVLPRQVGRW